MRVILAVVDEAGCITTKKYLENMGIKSKAEVDTENGIVINIRK